MAIKIAFKNNELDIKNAEVSDVIQSMNNTMPIWYYVDSYELLKEVKGVIAKLYGRYYVKVHNLLLRYKDRGFKKQITRKLLVSEKGHSYITGRNITKLSDALDMLEFYQYELCSIIVPKGSKVEVIISPK